MKLIIAMIFACGTMLIPTASFAYQLNGPGCDGNGQACRVNCQNGPLAGIMYFNGDVWTDGVKSDRSKDAEAKAICAANGTACI